MEHSFDVNVAEKVGIEAAIILKNIYWWCKHNKANKKNLHDGKAWTYNSRKAYGELFPYMKDSRIRTALKNLSDEGYIETGTFNKTAYDRTTWYTVTEAGANLLGVDISHLLYSPMEETYSPMDRQNTPMEKNYSPDDTRYIPDKKTDSKPHTSSSEERFAKFWQAYPKKQGKGNARKAFAKLKVNDSLLSQMLVAIEIQKRTPQWQRDGGQYIPYPSTWLNGERWEDEPSQNAGAILQSTGETLDRRKLIN